MVMKSIISTPGKLTQPAQPTVQAGPTMKTAPNMGTPNTPAAPVNSWQRGTRGMDRVKMPGVNSYAPQRPATPPITSGIGYMTNPATRGTAGVSPGQNPMSPFAPGGRMDPLKQTAAPAETGPRPWGVSRPGEMYPQYEGPGNPGWEQRHPEANPTNGGGQPPLSFNPPQGNISSRLFAKPRAPQNMPTGFGGVGVAPTGDTSTWTAGDWQRYNQFQQQQQNPLVNALSNYKPGG